MVCERYNLELEVPFGAAISMKKCWKSFHHPSSQQMHSLMPGMRVIQYGG